MDDVGHASAAGNQGRTPVDHAIPDGASGIVAGGASAQQWPAQAGSEGFDNLLLEYRVSAGVHGHS
jgi:hypothetical protein